MIKTASVTTATADPVDLEEVKDHLRLPPGETAEDDYLQGLLDSAVEFVQDYTGQKLLTQTHYVYFDEWPCSDHVELPFAPLQSVSSTGFSYVGSTGATNIFSSTGWRTDTVSFPPRVVLKYDSDWPTETLDNSNPIRVKGTFGYTTQGKIPASLKHAIKLLISDWYENRESIVTGVTVNSIPNHVRNLLDRYKVNYFK